MALPTAIYSAAQVRALDDYAIQTLGTPGYTLMKRAGEASLRALRSRWPTAHRIAIVCGGGNNGGDGYVLARFARAAGLTVSVLAAVPVESLRGDAQRAAEEFVAGGGVVAPFAPEVLAASEVIVDALLGIGARGPLRPDTVRVIEAINAARRPVFALDLPSGLAADSGVPLGAAVQAEATLTFVGLKTGLFIGEGPEHVGTLQFDDLGITPPAAAEFAPRLLRASESDIARALPRRRRTSHKGSFGHVLVVGGGPGMPGAVRLAGESALRVGAGLVTVAVAPENVAAISAGCPELIVVGLDVQQFAGLLARADVVAIGPGLGRSAWAWEVLGVTVAAGKPLVVDADALNILADDPSLRADSWILTPHPGEAGRLLGVETAAVQADRLEALGQLCRRYGGTIVLKGAGTLVGREGETPQLCERGNPGMASAGMGDVLTGVIAGILAQLGDPLAAARVGVLVHALAGDTAARSGERGLIARDVIGELRTWVNI
ncbi:MAG: Bifunctional NAD(P)H-hydrate repair enzyme Nnr [Steroidobacteraceae bacterium]|nr:Bifunctional NAD(P)H-hydrate repair enzyme Nnr [Steroidobacteraceae bacterium]